MNKRRISISSILLGTAVAAPALAGTAPHMPPGIQPSLPHYVIRDVGSFGGGFGIYSNPGSRALNSSGANVGVMSTGNPDPFCPDWCFYDGYVDHAFEWKKGQITDLGALAAGVSSFALGINDKGLTVGISQTGNVDPVTSAPVVHGVRWQHQVIEDLGALGGSQSLAAAVNLSGQIAAPSETGASDPYLSVAQANCLWLPTGTGTACNQFDFGTNTFLLPVTSQTHAALGSPHKALRDLGTLGGPDSTALDINDSGQAVGWSYANYNAGNSGVPDTRPVVWDHGAITDMGSLGGTFGAAMLINKNGQAIGVSNLAGDTEVHPFIWDKDHGMTDLGSFGGWYSHPNWINDNGDVVGISSTADHVLRGFYWHQGVLINLGTVGTDDRSTAVSINNKGLIVGYTFGSDGSEIRAFISDQGGSLVDLNTLIRKPHGLNVLAAYYINDSNEIVGFALTSTGEIHPVVLIPENEADRLADGHESNAVQPAGRSHTVAHANPGSLCERGRVFARICAAR